MSAIGQQPLSVAGLNGLDRESFVRLVGPVFEHSPWIAEITWAKKPFASREQLLRALDDTVARAGGEKQLALIRAHPDLAGKLAQAGVLTRASTGEQAAAGLDRLTPEERVWFQKLNSAYQEKFGFPFILCARRNPKAAILAGLERRLENSRDQEIKTALEEIRQIAELRLHDLIAC